MGFFEQCVGMRTSSSMENNEDRLTDQFKLCPSTQSQAVNLQDSPKERLGTSGLASNRFINYNVLIHEDVMLLYKLHTIIYIIVFS